MTNQIDLQMAAMNEPLLGSPRRRIPSCSTILLTLSFATILCLAGFATLHLHLTTRDQDQDHTHLCHNAHNPTSCQAILSNLPNITAIKPSKLDLIRILMEQSVAHVDAAAATARSIRRRINDPKQQAGLADCMDLMDLSRTRLQDSLLALGSVSEVPDSHANVHTWLSAVLTNYATCMDGLQGEAGSAMKAQLENMMAIGSTSLALIKAVSSSNVDVIRPLNGRYPSWVTMRDRKLLEASSPKAIKADVVVAQDGSGKYKKVQDAVSAAPDNSKIRYVIYVKKGTYKEKVEVGKKKKNIMMVGDGMDSTIITGSLNFVDGTTTFNTATVAAVGDGFIAQDMWFQNTAGPEKHQAVALRVGADTSVINRCRIDAYQDTLYAHSLRQFYRDCSITGTVDFIFGNAAVVFQNCTLIARKPMSNQKNIVTAQGRTDPNQNTATSIQNCQVIASSDLTPVKAKIPSYLGRPWKEYSRTVYIQSYIDDHVNPAGWLEWSGDFALKTLYYGEYANKGPGAGTSKRVQWPGYHVITDAKEAKKFTVGELIQGGTWLTSTGVAFTEGL